MDMSQGIDRATASAIPFDHRLAPLVAEAYSVMAAPHPFSHGVCRACCLPPALEESYFGLGQREISVAFLRAWYRASPEKDMTPEVMSWLLPRVLELMAMGETDIFPNIESAFQRLELTGFPNTWSPRAVDVFERFARAQFRRMVIEDASELDALIAMFANSGFGAAPFLTVLWDMPTESLSRALHQAFCETEPGWIVQTPLWSSQDDRTKTWAWYLSPDMSERLCEAAGNGDEKAGAVADLIDATLKGPGHAV